jgi:hypothetical protein
VIGSTFYIVSANQHDLPGAYVKNLGTIIRTGGQVRGGFGGSIDNAGVWLEQTDNEINEAFGSGEFFLNGGTFSKAGTIGASTFQSGTSFTNSGTLQVLGGMVTFNGSYSQNLGTMQFGVTSTASYGKVGLAGPINFNGTLALSPQGGYTAALGDTLTPLTYASGTAEFGNLNLTPVPAGDAWQVSYNPAALVLTVITPGASANQITGSVKDAPTHGVPGITVFAFNTNANNQAVYVSTVTDANGLYSLSVSNSTWVVGLAALAAAGYNPVADQTAVVNGANQVVNFLIQAIGAVTPTATTTPATGISQTGATLNGTVNPGGEAASVYFAYGTGVLNHFTPTNTITSNLNGIQAQSAALTGLSPTTQYQFQLIVVNSLGSTSGNVLNFTTLGSVPTTITLAPTAIGSTNATMNGSVNPNSLATSYYWEYGPTTNYGTFSATNAAGAGTTPVLVSDALTNLSPATVYHYQLVASNSAGTILGGDMSWTNHNATPYVTTLAATGIGTTTATLNGSINPNGLDTAWYFEYGLGTTYGSFTPTNTVSATNTSQAVASALAGLTPTTIYHFQLVGSNQLGIVLGGDLTLTNGAVAPVATTTAASGVSLTGATLNGTVNPGGETVNVYFAYGTIALNRFTSTNTITANLNSTQPQSVTLTGLTPATQYQFQIVAVNSVGTNMGSVLNFTTPGSGPITITLPASAIGTTNATMNGSVNPGGLATSYYFEYGLTASYGSFTVTNPVGAGTTPVAVANTLTNLSPATAYHFQVVAVNSSATTLGGDLTWTNSNASPTVATLAATAIGTTTATLHGAINPNGLDTAWYFEYGTTTTYGRFTPTNHLAATNTSQALASAIAGLAPNSTYHFQLVGSNALGAVLGGDLTLTTITNTTVAAMISCPANITTNTAPGQCLRSLAFAPIATGSPTPTVTCKIGSTVITSPFAFPLGTNLVTCTASNVAGTASCSFTVTVSDTEPPVLTCPTDITVAAPSGQLGTTVNFVASATDNCGGVLPVTCTPQPGYFALGQTPVQCEAVDASGNRSTCSFTVTVTATTDTSRLCSLTQGFYGNAKRRFNGITSLVLVGQLLGQGPLVVGKAGVRSLSILPGDASLLEQRLPAGGPPAALPNNGDQTLETAVLPSNRKGRFADVFLGQTITLSLNTRLNPALLSFGLGSSFCTQGVLAGRDGCKGTSDDDSEASDIQQFNVPASVLSALLDAGVGINDGTVKGLLELANRALAGLAIGSATLADVNAAVDVVNRGFDECRVSANCGTSTITQDSFNDDFTNRPTLGSGGANLEVRGSNLDATKEPGEPELAGNPGGKSVWWQWKAPLSGPVTISTMGSSFDTLLGVYTGTSISNLVLVGSNDDADGGLASEETFEAQAGIDYQITVDGVDGASGEIVMTLAADRPQLCQRVTVVNNRVQFCINGETGRIYTIEGSPDLEHWTLLATSVSTNGVLGLTDRAMSNFKKRHYRVTFEP